MQNVCRGILSISLMMTVLAVLVSCSIKADVSDTNSGNVLVLNVDTSTNVLEINEGSTLALVVTQSAKRSSKTPVTIEVSSPRGDTTAVFGTNPTVTAEIDTGKTWVLTSLSSVHDVRYTGARSFNLKVTSTDAEIKSSPLEFTLIVKDLEAAPVISVNVPSQHVSEGAGSAVVGLTMSLEAIVPMTVSYSFTNGTASSADYTSTAGSVVFAPGELTKNITIPIIDDAIIEAAETFTMNLGAITGGAVVDATKASHTVTIDDNDLSDPVANFSLASQSVNESSGLRAVWPSALSSWKARRKVRIENGAISEALTNFPVLVKLNSSRVNYAKTQNSGQDLRFTDENGVNLSYEIEKWDESGTSSVWVLLPSVTANSNAKYFWMYYDNAAASAASSASSVWGGFHQATYHFADNALDATGLNPATAVSMTYADTDVTKGGAFDGTSGYVQLPSGFSNFSAGITLEAWVRPTAASSYARLFDLGYGASNGDIVLGRTSVSTNLFYYVGGCNLDFSNVLTLNTWQHIAISHAAGSVKLYKNGAEIGSGACALPPIATRTSNFIGKSNWAGDALWTGGMDEVRIQSTPRSANWIKARYLSDLDNYLSVNSEESLTFATHTITVNLSAPAASPVSLSYTVTGTATSPADHTLTDGTLSIAAGDSSGTISFQVMMDGITEGDETFVVTLTAATNAVLGTGLTHTVTIVDAVNAAPVAVADAVSLVPDSSGSVATVLANDSDPNGDLISITATTAPAKGTISVGASTITYTPTAGFSGIDTFTYTIADEFGATSTATVTVTVRSPFSWTGAAGDGKSNTAGNWYGNAVPGPGDTAYFANAFCGANCNMTVFAPWTVNGLALSSSYTGTITQSAELTINSYGLQQASGTFQGGSANVTMYGPTNVTGGAYRATSGVTYVNVNGYAVQDPATFDANGGTLNNAYTLNLPANATVQNYTASISPGGVIWTANSVIIAGTFDVDGPSDGNGGGGCVSWGTFNLQGDIILRGYGLRQKNHYCGSSGQIRINGTGDQTITNVGGGAGIMKTVVDKATGTLFMPAALDVRYQFEVTQGMLSGNTAVHFYGSDTYCGLTSRLGFGGMSLSSLVIDQYCEVLAIIGGPLQVNGNITYSPHLEYGRPLSGTIKLTGNFEVTDRGFEGGTIEFNGSGNQTLTRSGADSASVTPNYVINNSGMAGGFGVTLLTSYPLQSGRNLTVTQGRLNLLNSGVTMDVPGTAEVSAGAEINLNGGALTYGARTGTGVINP